MKQAAALRIRQHSGLSENFAQLNEISLVLNFKYFNKKQNITILAVLPKYLIKLTLNILHIL